MYSLPSRHGQSPLAALRPQGNQQSKLNSPERLAERPLRKNMLADTITTMAMITLTERQKTVQSIHQPTFVRCIAPEVAATNLVSARPVEWITWRTLMPQGKRQLRQKKLPKCRTTGKRLV